MKNMTASELSRRRLVKKGSTRVAKAPDSEEIEAPKLPADDKKDDSESEEELDPPSSDTSSESEEMDT